MIREQHQSLLAAGFWNYLREDITFSLFERCPLKMDLDAIPPPANIMSDQAYLNMISLILGKIINGTFSSSALEGGWLGRLDSVQAWRTTLPQTFEPYSRASDPPISQGLPTIRMLGHHHSKDLAYLRALRN